MLNLIGSALIHTLGRDAVAEHWGLFKENELNKFVNGEVTEWKCHKCKAINDITDSSCREPFVNVKLISPEGYETQAVVRKSDLEGHFVGRVLHVGQEVSWWHINQLKRGEILHIKTCRTRKRLESLRRRKVECSVLLLGKDGSHGLDLSMVSHVFFVDKIWDPALESQVIARAWRMGSPHRGKEIVVEHLLLRGTLEEYVHALPMEMNLDAQNTYGNLNMKNLVVRNLKFIRDLNPSVAFPPSVGHH